ncbi:plexin domain-containing protein 2 [Amyelois transitella]|uniref:plexin domain-containing protein 2 n=1 Tax=Amyelois transitella TaxID=680683 RepID=UPI00298FA907|nr:plexin domain-containing protein 2 [Amyelois transitella]
MDFFQVKVYKRWVTTGFLLVFFLSKSAEAWKANYDVESVSSGRLPSHIMTLERQRRDILPMDIPTTPTTGAPASVPTGNPVVASSTTVDDSNRTNKNFTAVPTPAVTEIPLLGVNGSGILKVDLSNVTKVSDPIMPDDGINVTEILTETPEMIKAEHNLTALTYDDHDFYNSSFIGNVSYFNEHWNNITASKATVHNILSHSHRRAASINLSFPFPFYGHNITNITMATGGFIYTGDHVHNWLAATQYIAPLMANFDTTISNDSVVSYSDDGEKFTAFWHNVALQENSTSSFTFACTLYKNGDIVFAYKIVPMRIQDINETFHPVKVGISDAYITDKIVFYVRRKTIYEYHRASFKNHDIANNTILRLEALPTCTQYDTCDGCINHNTAFNCTWCNSIRKCSSGTDKNKQDWMLRSCDRRAVTNVTMCPAKTSASENNSSTAYVTIGQGQPYHDPVLHAYDAPQSSQPRQPQAGQSASDLNPSPSSTQSSSVGGVVAAFVCIALVLGLAGWTLYAFRNPTTRSGQFLIKYRPTQWNWRRGEARYTAATIHM